MSRRKWLAYEDGEACRQEAEEEVKCGYQVGVALAVSTVCYWWLVVIMRR